MSGRLNQDQIDRIFFGGKSAECLNQTKIDSLNQTKIDNLFSKEGKDINCKLIVKGCIKNTQDIHNSLRELGWVD